MISVTRDLIEYYGIADYLPSNLTTYKQINVEDEIALIDCAPNISQIIKVYSTVNIESTRTVTTPKGTSLEGVTLTGHKLFVHGFVNQKIQYLANNDRNTIHTTQITTPFVSSIILPADFYSTSYISTSAFIEDVYVAPVNPRCIYQNTTLLLSAEIY